MNALILRYHPASLVTWFPEQPTRCHATVNDHSRFVPSYIRFHTQKYSYLRRIYETPSLHRTRGKQQKICEIYNFYMIFVPELMLE